MKNPWHFFVGFRNYLYLCLLKEIFRERPMPTLLTIFGMRFYFYLDEHEPIHVHIDANGKKAKIALEPEVSLVYNHGLKEQELRKAIETCRIYQEDFITEWHKRFG